MLKRLDPERPVPVPSAAEDSGLQHVSDTEPGWTRRGAGKGFYYLDTKGQRMRDPAPLARIRSLAIPPAWREVWICPDPDGHIQATGRDARGRKQYRYHPDWTAAQSQVKYDSLHDFGLALPRIRRRIDRDLRSEVGDQRFALAAAALLIDQTAIRVGNAGYTAENGSYGATTLTRKHLRMGDGILRLNYTAKGGKKIRREIRSKRLMRALQKARDLQGQTLFSWIDGEETRSVTSTALNAYLAEAGADDRFTAKTFRTWTGSLAAFEAHQRNPESRLTDLARAASERLANTPTVARNSYIHPEVLALVDSPRAPLPDAISGLTRMESGLISLITR